MIFTSVFGCLLPCDMRFDLVKFVEFLAASLNVRRLMGNASFYFVSWLVGHWELVSLYPELIEVQS